MFYRTTAGVAYGHQAVCDGLGQDGLYIVGGHVVAPAEQRLRLLREMEQFLSTLDLQRTVFRSDHASNWLVLKGTLGADKARLLEQVRMAVAHPDAARLRPTMS